MNSRSHTPIHDHAHHDHAAHDHAHHDHTSHDHDHHDHTHHHGLGGHDHSEELRNASKNSLIAALVLIVGYMFAEVIGGILSGSLALLADAGHMLTDAASIGLALVAMQVAARRASTEHTFGYHRFEILAALTHALTLWAIAIWIAFEAYERFREVPEVEGGLMLTVGTIGLVVNIAAAWILHRPAEHSVNVEGAFQHVMADLMGSVGVVISGSLIWAFGWTLADPIISVGIGILILASTWRLLAKIVNVLLEGTPKHIDVYRLCSKIEEVEGVTLIHDVHVWTIAPNYEAFTAHVLVDPEYRGNFDDLRQRLRKIVSHDFGIAHMTIQLERSMKECTENHHVDHLLAHARPTT